MKKYILFAAVLLLTASSLCGQSKAEYQQQIARMNEQMQTFRQADSISQMQLLNMQKMLNDNYQVLHRADSLSLAEQKAANKILEDRIAQQDRILSNYENEVKRLSGEIERLSAQASPSSKELPGTPHWVEIKGGTPLRLSVPQGKIWVFKGTYVCKESENKYNTRHYVNSDKNIVNELSLKRNITIPNTDIHTDMEGIVGYSYQFPEGTTFDFQILYKATTSVWDGENWGKTISDKTTPSDVRGYVHYVEYDAPAAQ